MKTIEINENNIISFVENKREIFDLMRAYQSSELAHKSDIIGVLKIILTVTIALYAAILGALFTPELEVHYKNIIAWAIFFSNAIVIFIVINATNKKIIASNKMYKKHGQEYERFTKILDLNKYVLVNGEPINGKTLDPENPIGSGDGFKKSIHIINEIGYGISVLCFALALTVSFIDVTPG
jgi:hypothetical protein